MNDPFDSNHMDDLMHQAFDRHEEIPSDRVWQGIEAGLDERSGRRPVALFWWLGVLMIALSTGTWWHFQGKKELSGEKKHISQERSDTTPETGISQTNHNSPAAPVPENPKSKISTSNSLRAIVPPPAVEYQKGKKKAPSHISSQINDNGKTKIISPDRGIPNPLSIGHDRIDTSQSTRDVVYPGPSAPLLPVLSPRLLEQPLPALHPIPVKSGKKTVRKWMLATGVSILASRQSVRSTGQRPAQPGTLPVAITAESQNPAREYSAGIELGRALGKRWELWSGLRLQQLQINTLHIAKMRRVDGQYPGQPVGGDLRFRYLINTPTGGVAVDVRMEQVDTTLQLPPNEPVVFAIQTRQTLKYASLPLFAVYRIGQGRWNAILRGGATFNFLQHNDLVIERFESRTDRFRPAQLLRPLAFNEYLRRFNVGFQMGAGVRFSVSERLSVGLESLYSGQMSSNNGDPYLQTRSYSIGLNASILCKF
ncbi:MAG: hypothetical protein H6565_15935 [Lewinellaceae bacterium]|nr:hypothetical protein [Lewinellaceae bacterium]